MLEVDVEAVEEGVVILVEVISFGDGDDEAVTSTMLSCSDVELVLISIGAAVGLK